MPPTATKSNWKPVNPPGSSFPRAVPDDPCNTSLPVPFMNVRPMVFEHPAFPPQGGGTRNLPKDITWAHVDPSQTPGRKDNFRLRPVHAPKSTVVATGSHADKSYQVTWAQEKHTSAKRKEMLSKQSVRVKKPKPIPVKSRDSPQYRLTPAKWGSLNKTSRRSVERIDESSITDTPSPISISDAETPPRTPTPDPEAVIVPQRRTFFEVVLNPV